MGQLINVARNCLRAFGFATVVFTASSILQAAEPELGSTLESVLAESRRLNPELIAAVLDAEAATEAIRGSDSLPDPEFQLESENNGFKGQSGTRTYWIGQEFPLGGKLGLKRSIATSESERMTARREQVRLDLEARIKIVQAERFRGQAVIRLLGEIHQDLGLTEKIANALAREGRGRQADAIRTRIALINHQADQTRAIAEYRQFDTRLNLLLGRAPREALVPPKSFETIPDQGQLQEDRLYDFIRQKNFSLIEQAATVRMGESQVELAKKDWYPNVKVQLGLDEAQGRGVSGYEGFLTVNLPLRTEKRQGVISSEVSKLGAAKARRDLELQKLEAMLAEQLIIFRATREIEQLLRTEAVPQARAGEQSLRRLYQEGGNELTEVLAAQAQRRQAEIEWLKTQSELRQQLAEIERLIGGAL